MKDEKFSIPAKTTEGKGGGGKRRLISMEKVGYGQVDRHTTK